MVPSAMRRLRHQLGRLRARHAIRYRRTGARRSRAFRERAHDRYWWHRLAETDHVPLLYGALSDDEWRVLEAWYVDSERANLVGEMNVPALSLVQGLMSGNGLRRVVQLGHFSGWSTLLVGWTLRAMGGGRLASIDIDPRLTEFTQRWVERGGLQEIVALHTGDSASAAARDAALAALGGPPQLLLVDSSHGYAHTLRELDLWTPVLPAGAIALLHDTSEQARAFDPHGEGGVARALEEWLPRHPEVAALNLNAFVGEGTDANALSYRDGCGLGILQKRPDR